MTLVVSGLDASAGTIPATAGRRALPCQVNEPELWFADSPGGVALAKALCAECPVRTACLTAAVQRREPWGVWGGELLSDGVVVPRKRPRGRPRKHEAAA